MKQFPPGTRPEDTKKIEAEIEVDATVEEIWPYLSTSDGLSSWYVGAEFEEEKAGAKCTLTFGPGMVVPAFVQSYEVNDHVRLGPPPSIESPRVEEYSVRPKKGGGCIVRVVNWGFGEGADWDAEYDAVKKGWQLFLGGLKIIVERFRGLGRPETIQLVSISSSVPQAWGKMKEGLGNQAVENAALEKGVTLGSGISSEISGTVYALGDHELGLYKNEEGGGLHFYAVVESPDGASAMVSITMRFFGASKGAASAVRDAWGAWFGKTFPQQ